MGLKRDGMKNSSIECVLVWPTDDASVAWDCEPGDKFLIVWILLSLPKPFFFGWEIEWYRKYESFSSIFDPQWALHIPKSFSALSGPLDSLFKLFLFAFRKGLRLYYWYLWFNYCWCIRHQANTHTSPKSLYPEELKIGSQRGRSTAMFTAASFATPEMWKSSNYTSIILIPHCASASANPRPSLSPACPLWWP